MRSTSKMLALNDILIRIYVLLVLLLSIEILGCYVASFSKPSRFFPRGESFYSHPNHLFSNRNFNNLFSNRNFNNLFSNRNFNNLFSNRNFNPTQQDTPAKLFEDYWYRSLVIYPELATIMDYHANDDKMDSHTLQEYKEEKAIYEQFMIRAQKLEKLATNSEDKLNLYVLIWELELLITEKDLNKFPFFLTNMKGPHTHFRNVIFSQKLEVEEDFWKYLQRLRDLTIQVYQDIELLKIGIQTGRTLHNLSMYEVPKQISELLGPTEQSVFYFPFQHIITQISEIPQDAKIKLQSEAFRVIRDEVQVAYRDFYNFLTQEYFHTLRPNIGLSSIPGGKEYYIYCLKKYTSTDLSPEKIHQMGLREVKRIDEVMQEIIRNHGSNENLRQFSEKLRHDPRFVFKSPEEKLNTARHNLFEIINPTLLRVFWKMPSLDLRVMSTPESQSNGPGASYVPGSIRSKRPGTVFVNTKYYQEFPKYDLLTDCMHEGNPGHHLQNTYFMEKKNIPKFRLHDLNNFFGAFHEGWALYAEYLGLELGIFENLYDRYGHFSWENFRAARLVVDTGIHYYGWTKQQAMDYFLKHTAASVQEIEREVNRYITMPGQACGYKIAEMKIRELRKKAEAELGPHFDIRDFHVAVLDCANAPVIVLQHCVDDYIAKCLAELSDGIRFPLFNEFYKLKFSVKNK